MQPRVCAKCLVFSMATKCNQKPRAYRCDRARAHARRMLFFSFHVFFCFFSFFTFYFFFGCLVAFFLKSASQIRRRLIPLQPSATKCNQTKPKFFNNSAPPSFSIFAPYICIYTYIGTAITPVARRSSARRTRRPAVCLSSPSRGDSGVSCQPRCHPAVKSS